VIQTHLSECATSGIFNGLHMPSMPCPQWIVIILQLEHCLHTLPQVLILLIPNFIEATMYTTCGKISAFGNTPRHLCFMRPAFVTWFYIVSDVVTIVVQAIGIGIWASARSGDRIDQEQAVRGRFVAIRCLFSNHIF